jgi:AcrR family transcriptional regulator
MADKERKLQIIRAALKRFVKHGLHKTTLDEIARDLRIGKATLYHYFNSKEDLYYQTLSYEIAGYMNELKSIFTAEENDIRKKLTEYFFLKENFESRYKLIFDLFLHMITGAEFPHEKEIFQEMIIRERDFFQETVSSVIKSNDYKPNELAAFISRQGWNVIFENRIRNEDKSLPDDKEIIFSMIEKTC